MIKTFKMKKTGNTFINTPDDPATLPTPQQMILSEFAVMTTDKNGNDVVRKTIQEREMKMLFFLLHAVYDELGKVKTHEIPMEKIHNTLCTQYGFTDESTTWIWDAVEILSTMKIKWVETQGDERWKSIASLMPYASTNADDRKTGVLKFEFYDRVINVLKEQSRFSRLRLPFLMGLSGKYTIILYGILEGIANHKHSNTIEYPLTHLRQWLKIKETQYNKFNDLKRFVIEPAIKQINEDPEKSGLTVSYEPVKRGRKTIAIKFVVTKEESRKKIDIDSQVIAKKKNKKQMNFSLVSPETSDTSSYTPSQLSEFNMDKLQNIFNKNKIQDMQGCLAAYEQEWREWLQTPGKNAETKAEETLDLEGSFAGFVKFKTNK